MRVNFFKKGKYGGEGEGLGREELLKCVIKWGHPMGSLIWLQCDCAPQTPGTRLTTEGHSRHSSALSLRNSGGLATAPEVPNPPASHEQDHLPNLAINRPAL